MPVLTFAKSALGAIVDVSLSPSTRLQKVHAGNAWPPVTLHMLIDTGAEATAVDHDLIASWQLQPHSFVLLQSSGGINRTPKLDLALTILSPSGASWHVHDGLLVTAHRTRPYAGLPYGGVLGRDVLDRGRFTYDGRAHRCELEF